MQDSTNANLFGNWKLVWACLTNPLVLAIDIANDEDVCAGWIEEHHGGLAEGEVVVAYSGAQVFESITSNWIKSLLVLFDWRRELRSVQGMGDT